jgi:hypothetical protein
MTPATAIRTRRMARTRAVAGRTAPTMASIVLALKMVSQMMRPPQCEGLIYMKESSVTVGRAGRLSVHTLDERAHGMRERLALTSCMLGHYRSLCVVA